MPQETSKYKIPLGFAAIYLIWGSTYLAIRFGVETMPPFLMAGIRFVMAGLMVYGYLRLRTGERPRSSHWKPAIIMGLLMPAGGTGLVTWAELSVPSGLAALIVSMIPMWLVLGDWVRPGGNRPSGVLILGLVIGFAGIALLIDPVEVVGTSGIDKLGALLIVLATISWSAGTIYSRQAPQPRSKVMSAAMQMTCGGVALLAVSILTGELQGFNIYAVKLKSWLALGYLTIMGSVGFAVYIWLVSVTTVARVSTYAYVNPVVALGLGFLLAGETLNLWTLVCSAIVIMAVIIIITARVRLPREVESGAPRCRLPVCEKT